MKNKVVVLTHSADDYGALSVIKAITEAGGIPIRFNCDAYPGELQLSARYINGQWNRRIFDGKEWHDAQDINAVWFRRPVHLGGQALADIDEQYRQAAMQEAQRAFNDFFYTLDAFLLNSPHYTQRFYSKEYQLELASALGWRIPETCITNSPDELKLLLDKYPKGVIAKPLTSYFIDYEKEKGATLFSSLIHPQDLVNLEGLVYSPMIFQEPIPKKLELRIPVVGDKIWAYSIDSQSNANAQEDWRKAGLEMIDQWKPYALPESITTKIQAFMQKMGCTYGSFDVIVTPDEQYVFLEINTDGEFFWLDELSGFEISRAFAGLLLQSF